VGTAGAGGDALAAVAELVVGPAAERFLVRTGIKRQRGKKKKGRNEGKKKLKKLKKNI